MRDLLGSLGSSVPVNGVTAIAVALGVPCALLQLPYANRGGAMSRRSTSSPGKMECGKCPRG